MAEIFLPAGGGNAPNQSLLMVERGRGAFATGGTSEVYLAFTTSLKQPVAVKIIRLDGNTEKARKKFRSEMKAHSALGPSPFIIQYLGCYMYKHFAGVVMEYAVCGSLYDFLHHTFVQTGDESAKVTFGTSLRNRTIYDIIRGIQFLHNIGLDQRAIHGDLKTSNILLTGELHAKIADLGCTQLQTVIQAQSSHGLPEGDFNSITLRYTAPEVLERPRAKKQSSSDIYSFGVIVWEIWSREIPYVECTTRDDVIRAILGRIKLSMPHEPKYEDFQLVKLFSRCLGSHYSRPTATDIVLHFPLQFSEVDAMAEVVYVRRQIGDKEPTYPEHPEYLRNALDGSETPISPPTQTYRAQAQHSPMPGPSHHQQQHNFQDPDPNSKIEIFPDPELAESDCSSRDIRKKCSGVERCVFDFSSYSLQYKERGRIAPGTVGAVVYFCKRENDGKMFASKRVDTNFYTVADNEIEILKNVENENIVAYHGYIDDPKHFLKIIITQLCGGTVEQLSFGKKLKLDGNYKDYRQLKPIDQEKGEFINGEDFVEYFPIPVIDIVRQTVDGVQYLHDKDIVHRDIKPSNLFLYKKDNGKVSIKISDFGLSRKVGGNTSAMADVAGTPSFIAPEYCEDDFKQFKQVEPTKQADIFSLGLCLYYICTTCRHPYGDDSHIHKFRIKKKKTPVMKDLLPVGDGKNDPRIELTNEQRVTIHHLLRMMLVSKSGKGCSEPGERPTIEEVKEHPALWTGKRKVKMIEDIVEVLTEQCYLQRRRKTGQEKIPWVWKQLNWFNPDLLVDKRITLADSEKDDTRRWKYCIDHKHLPTALQNKRTANIKELHELYCYARDMNAHSKTQDKHVQEELGIVAGQENRDKMLEVLFGEIPQHLINSYLFLKEHKRRENTSEQNIKLKPIPSHVYKRVFIDNDGAAGKSQQYMETSYTALWSQRGFKERNDSDGRTHQQSEYNQQEIDVSLVSKLEQQSSTSNEDTSSESKQEVKADSLEVKASSGSSAQRGDSHQHEIDSSSMSKLEQQPLTLDKKDFTESKHDIKASIALSSTDNLAKAAEKISISATSTEEMPECIENQLSLDFMCVDEVSEIVGPSGAVLEVGGCKLIIPEGALEADVAIRTTTRYDRDAGVNRATPLLKCEPHGLKFNKEVEVVLPTCYLTDGSVSVAAEARRSEDGENWETIKSFEYRIERCFKFSISEFSLYDVIMENIFNLAVEKLIVCCILHKYSNDPENLVIVCNIFDAALKHKLRNCSIVLETSIALGIGEPGVSFQLVNNGISIEPEKREVKDTRAALKEQVQFLLTKRDQIMLFKPIILKTTTAKASKENEFFIPNYELETEHNATRTVAQGHGLSDKRPKVAADNISGVAVGCDTVKYTAHHHHHYHNDGKSAKQIAPPARESIENGHIDDLMVVEASAGTSSDTFNVREPCEKFEIIHGISLGSSRSKKGLSRQVPSESVENGENLQSSNSQDINACKSNQNHGCSSQDGQAEDC